MFFSTIMFFVVVADIPHGNEYFQNLVDIIEDPMEEDIDVPKESQAPENSNFDD